MITDHSITTMGDYSDHRMNDFLEQWYIGLELWYNHSDRYHEAMDVWLSAFRRYYDDDEYDNDSQPTNMDMDQFEFEWKKLMEEPEKIIARRSSTKNASTKSKNPSWFWHCHIFVAGTCLDAQRYHTARRLLHDVIRKHIVPSVLRNTMSETDHDDHHEECDATLRNECHQLLHNALQELMATYQEEEEEQGSTDQPSHDASSSSSSWMIGRRLATLRNLLSSHVQPQQNHHNQQQLSLWNATNIYQRPPYYIHYPTFALIPTPPLSEILLYDTPVLERSHHPEWCQQLEKHCPMILEELQQHVSTSSSTTTVHRHNNYDPWTPVGSSTMSGSSDIPYRHHQAGIHDGSVVAPGGNWQEIILYSAHLTTQSSSSFPRTKQWIERYCQNEVLTLMRTGVGEVILSRLGPQSTHILPHTASHNIRYTAHLPLIVPKTTTNDDPTVANSNGDCFIRVGERICRWEMGKMLVFDDSYEHEVINTTNEVRVVLLLRFWHPLLKSDVDRNRAIEYIEQAIHTDQLQRYNPPVPPRENDKTGPNAHGARLRRQCMEQSNCPYCHQTGYTSIRVIVETRSLICCCGRDI